MKRFGNLVLGLAGVGLLAGRAFGHPGHGVIDFGGGVVHPLTGIDHVAAMVAVGLWASLMGRRAMWMLPAAFVGMMVVGAGLAMLGVQLPGVEAGIAASVLVIGLLIMCGLRMPMKGGMALVGAFAVFHGWAHGQEMHAGSSAVVYGAGFVLATLMLHAIGLGLGVLLGQAKRVGWMRLAGASLAGYGALLMAGVL